MAADTPPPIPKNPFEMNWYVQGPAQADGPFTGYVLKEMIAKGQIAAHTNIAEVGATTWTRLADVPAFAALLPSVPLAAEGQGTAAVQYAGFWIRLLAYIIDVIVLELFALAAGVSLASAWRWSVSSARSSRRAMVMLCRTASSRCSGSSVSP